VLDKAVSVGIEGRWDAIRAKRFKEHLAHVVSYKRAQKI